MCAVLYGQAPVVISVPFQKYSMASTNQQDGSSESEFSDDEISSNDEGEASGEEGNDEEVSFNNMNYKITVTVTCLLGVG